MFNGRANLEYHNSWVIAICDKDTLEYYRWWMWRKTHIWLMRPKWGAHISIIRGEEEKEKKEFLFEFERKDREVTFNYSNLLEQHPHGYVWMPCWGTDLEDVREECGLPRKPIMPFHMTVGRSDLL